MHQRKILSLTAATLCVACSDSVVLSDAEGWLELRYDCERITPVARSNAEQSIVRDYAQRIVYQASQEGRLDSLAALVEQYGAEAIVPLESEVVAHMCRDGRIASHAQVDSARMAAAPPPAPDRPARSPEADSLRAADPYRTLLRGDRAPDFIAPRLDSAYLQGRPDHMGLSDFRGRWVLLDFWATWCGPCRTAHPHIIAFAERYADRGVSVLGVLYQDWPRLGLRYLEDDLSAPYSTVVDEGAKIGALYGVFGLPHFFLVDPSGTIAVRATAFDPDYFAEYIETSSLAGA